jgi:hypothetical protein
MQVSGQTVRSRFIRLKEKLCQQHGHFQGEPALAVVPGCRLPISQWPALSVTALSVTDQRPRQRATHCLVDACRPCKARRALGGHQGSRQADRRWSRPVVRSAKSPQRFSGCLRVLCPHFPSPRPALHHDARPALAVANRGWSSASL